LLTATGGDPRESATETKPPSYMRGKGETSSSACWGRSSMRKHQFLR